MRIIIAGTRTFDDVALLQRKLDRLTENYAQDRHSINGHPCKGPVILSGAAKGADKLGEWWAAQCRYVIRRFHADWNKHGKSAGYIRNKEMAREADWLIAFWDGKSKGTKNMIEMAETRGLRVTIIRYNRIRVKRISWDRWLKGHSK